MTKLDGAILLGHPKSHSWELLYPMPEIQTGFDAVDGFAVKQLVLYNSPSVTSGFLNSGQANKQAFRKE